MNLVALLLIVICLVAILGGLPPSGPWHLRYGYAPMSVGTIVLLVVLVLLLTGRL